MGRTCFVLAVLLFGFVLGGQQVAYGFTPAGTPLSDADKGAVIAFGGKRWILLDPAERKLLLHQDDVAGKYFWGQSHRYEPVSDSYNALYRLLNTETDRDGKPTFYADLGEEKHWIEPRYWNVRSEEGDIVYGDGEVLASIGLLTKSEHEMYRYDPELNIGNAETFLLTPTDNGGLWRVFVEHGSARYEWLDAGMVQGLRSGYRPVVHLKDHLYVSGGLGTADDPHVLSELPMFMDPEVMTIQDVTVTVQFPQEATDRHYKIGVTDAVYYSGPFTVSDNGEFVVTYRIDSEWKEARGKISHIDRVPPFISGVADGVTYTAAVKPQSDDKDIQFVQLTRDGEPVPAFEWGSPIATDGQYQLTVVDLAGNVTSIDFQIEIADENRPSVLGAFIEGDGYGDLIVVIAMDREVSVNWDAMAQIEVRTVSGDPVEIEDFWSWGNNIFLYLSEEGLPPGEGAYLDLPGALVSADHLSNLPATDLLAEDTRIYRGEDGRIGIREIAAHVRKWQDVEYYVLDEYALEYFLYMIEPIHPVKVAP